MKEFLKEYINSPTYKPKGEDGLFSCAAGAGHNDYIEFREAIAELLKEGEIVPTSQGKLIALSRSGYIKGTFRASGRGFGFVTPEGERTKDNDIFIPGKYTRGALEGDIVICTSVPSKEGKSREGEVRSILCHSIERVVGTLVKMPVRGRKGRRLFAVAPDDKKIGFQIVVSLPTDKQVRVEDKVEVKITKYPEGPFAAKGEITEVFGHAYTREANYASILHSNGIRTTFDEAVLAEADREAEDIPDTADGREDITDKILFTIDGEDAKDLDDAVSLEKTEEGYLLGVHIADVSHYVRQGSALDREAFERGTSVYFTDQVVPMLPKALSNGICSLNPGVNRRALSAFITLDKKGSILSCDVKKTLIKSRVRGVYSEVNDLFEKGESSEFYSKYSLLYPDTLPNMYELYTLLAKKSGAKGALELETEEAKILVDQNGLPTDIIKRERGDAEKLIEQFMLCANEAVANWLYDMAMPCVYRIHEDPDPEKIKDFSIFAHNLGLNVRSLGAKKLHPSALTPILSEAKEKGIGNTVSSVLLRSLSKAKYSSHPLRHFGLSIDKYCHFTSPIRRYPDLFTHRIITNILSGNISEGATSYLATKAEAAAIKSSENEIKAVCAEREIEDLYKCIYMFDSIGEEFDAVISSVTGFGIFCRLENTCEGLVPIASLAGYYVYNEPTKSLVCGAHSYKPGDRVRIVIEDIDIITRKIEMKIIG